MRVGGSRSTSARGVALRLVAVTAALTKGGWRVSSTTVGRLLHELGYSLQSVRKSSTSSLMLANLAGKELVGDFEQRARMA